MRSFHATRKDGEDSDCKSLGFSKAQVEVYTIKELNATILGFPCIIQFFPAVPSL